MSSYSFIWLVVLFDSFSDSFSVSYIQLDLIMYTLLLQAQDKTLHLKLDSVSITRANPSGYGISNLILPSSFKNFSKVYDGVLELHEEPAIQDFKSLYNQPKNEICFSISFQLRCHLISIIKFNHQVGAFKS